MNAIIEEPLKLVLSNASSIHVHPVDDDAPTHLVVVHVPWPAPRPQGDRAIMDATMDDDLAQATWEDAEWQ
jgi:hypothetical protein